MSDIKGGWGRCTWIVIVVLVEKNRAVEKTWVIRNRSRHMFHSGSDEGKE